MAVALPGDVVIDDGVLVRAAVVVDVKRHLRLEVIDQLERFDEGALRAFALDVFASIEVDDPDPAATPG